MNNLTRCRRCIMDDSSDDTIIFDENGVCNYCTRAYEELKNNYWPNLKGKEKLNNWLNEIRKNSIHNKYDCIMGLSGGLDSSYLAYLGCKWGLRILFVHIDDGFDTDISKKNLNKLSTAIGSKIINIKVDEKQYNSLIRAYMRAGVPNLAIPQDNILLAMIYKYARYNKIKYFLSGGNLALESILQVGNTYDNCDIVNMKDIHKKFGEKSIDRLNFISTYQRFIYKTFYDIETPRLLNLIDYNKEQAFKELNDFCDFEYYGMKHCENILTAFTQLYWFYHKFKVDKRTSHLSSMIVSGQISREQAMDEYNKPLYEEKMMSEYVKIIKQKLEISDNEFDMYFRSPNKQHMDYKTDKLIGFLRTLGRKIKS